MTVKLGFLICKLEILISIRRILGRIKEKKINLLSGGSEEKLMSKLINFVDRIHSLSLQH